MKNKKIFWLILSLFLFLTPACSKGSGKICIFAYDEKDTFISSFSEKLRDKFIDDASISISYAENSQPKQNSQIVSALKNDPSILLVNIVDRLSASSIIEKSVQTNTPIIFYNREPLLEDVIQQENIYYVGTDPVFEGKSQAEIANELYGGSENFKNSKFDKNDDGKLQVFLIKGELGHQDTELRSKTCIEELVKLGYDVDIVYATFCDWSRDKSNYEFGKVYEDYKNEDGTSKIELLLSNNDNMALGVVDFLKTTDEYTTTENIIDTFFPIIGTDGTGDMLKAIKTKEVYGTVKNNSEKQSDAIYKLAQRILKCESLDDFEYKFDENNNRFIHICGEIIVSKHDIIR